MSRSGCRIFFILLYYYNYNNCNYNKRYKSIYFSVERRKAPEHEDQNHRYPATARKQSKLARTGLLSRNIVILLGLVINF